MLFRLPVQLPLEARTDGGAYVVELVELASTGEHCLRARHADEPVVFLLARFEDARAAEVSLERGFKPVDGSFQQSLLLHLVDEGQADICVPRRNRNVVQPAVEPASFPAEPDDELILALP